MSALILLEMDLVVAHICREIFIYDEAQCQFTELPVESMGGDLADVGPMETQTTGRKTRIWIHLALSAVTPGVYAIVFDLLALHRVNQHVSSQWEYGERLVTAISRLEGASAIGRVESDEKGKVTARILSMRRGGSRDREC